MPSPSDTGGSRSIELRRVRQTSRSASNSDGTARRPGTSPSPTYSRWASGGDSSTRLGGGDRFLNLDWRWLMESVLSTIGREDECCAARQAAVLARLDNWCPTIDYTPYVHACRGLTTMLHKPPRATTAATAIPTTGRTPASCAGSTSVRPPSRAGSAGHRDLASTTNSTSCSAIWPPPGPGLQSGSAPNGRRLDSAASELVQLGPCGEPKLLDQPGP